MKSFKVRLLLPYEGLIEVVRSVSADYPLLELVSSVATLDVAVSQAIEAEKAQFDAIISRGDTMAMIRDSVSIPVFNIEVSGLDFIRAITLAESYSRKWAFLGFPYIMQQAKNLCEMLHNDASVNIIHSITECEAQIQRLVRDGYTMIVGDAVTVSWASKFGLYGIMIASSKDSVCKTLDAVSTFGKKTAAYRDTIGLYKEVMNKSPRNTLVFDAAENLVLYSGLNAMELSSQLRSYVKSAFNTSFVQNILLRNNEVWKVETRELSGPAVSNNNYVAFFCNRLNDAGALLDFTKNEKIKVFEPIQEKPILLNTFPHNSPAMREAVLAAQSHSLKSAPLFFIGEIGVETDTFAHAVYQASPFANNSMLQLDCAYLNTDDWNRLLSNAAQPLFRLLKDSTFVLYLKNINKMPSNTQELFFNVLTKTQQFSKLWLLASATNLQTILKSGSSFEKLFYQISPLIISIPPLRQRSEDIADLCSLAIGENNIRFGKSVVGIENEALDFLRRFSWPGNLPQFNNAMVQLIKNANGDYITLTDVKSILNYYTCTQVADDLPCIDLHDTLENIERAIIRYVYEQENQNGSKAAERLNIGRSTLWRKLNRSDFS